MAFFRSTGKRHKGMYRFKHAFTVLLVSFVLMLVVPVFSSVYFYSQVVGSTEQNAKESTLYSLRTAGTRLNHVLSAYDDAASRMVFDTSLHAVMSMDRPRPGSTEMHRLVSFIQRLDQKLGPAADIMTGYRLFVRENELVFYPGAMSSGLAFYYQNALRYEGMDFTRWYAAVFQPKTKGFLAADTIHFGQQAIRAITYNYPISRRAAGGATRNAVIQFFIDDRMLEDSLPFLKEAGSVHILSAGGEVLASLGEGAYPAGYALPASALGYTTLDEHLVIHSSISPELTLVASLPKSYVLRDAYRLRAPLLGILLVCVALEAGLGLVLAKRNAKPIERFVSDVKPLLPNAGQNSEYAYFDHSVAQLRQSQQTASAAAAQRDRLGISLLVDRMLSEGPQDEEALHALAASLDINLDAQGYCVATMQAEDAITFYGHSPASLPRGLRCLVQAHHSKSVSLIYFCDTREAAASHEQIRGHLETLRAGMAGPVRTGVGRIYDRVEDLSFSLQQSFYCVQLDAALTGTAIFDEVGRNSNAPAFTLEKQQRLLNAIKNNNTALIDQQMDELIDENTEKRHLSSGLKKLLIASAESVLLMAAEEIVQEENLSDYLMSVQRPADIRARLESLRQEMKKIGALAASRYKVRNTVLRQEIEAYLAASYTDAALSASAAAAHFGLSESYFSVLFKEVFGIPYSNHLENLRLEKAQALIQSTSMSIEDIASAVGYNNSTTFRRAFKRVHGVSPVQHRNNA